MGWGIAKRIFRLFLLCYILALLVRRGKIKLCFTTGGFYVFPNAIGCDCVFKGLDETVQENNSMSLLVILKIISYSLCFLFMFYSDELKSSYF